MVINIVDYNTGWSLFRMFCGPQATFECVINQIREHLRIEYNAQIAHMATNRHGTTIYAKS